MTDHRHRESDLGLKRQRFGLIFGVLVAAALPFLFALLRTPEGSRYLGFEYNSDDHMVYAAWMRQAMAGRFLFDNRFTTDPQPGLTIHVYFLILGWLGKLIGIPWAAFGGRILFSGLFLGLVGRLIRPLGLARGETTLSLVFVAFGGGIGFLFWQMFGTTFTKPSFEPMRGFLLNQLPVDVWQPEGFVFSSMLTNGLFMVSLCLALLTYEAILNAREGWKSVGLGFVSVAVLMNIHSYDVLIIALVMGGFLAAQLSRRQVEWIWIVRAGVVGSGAILPALWFVHVLQSDPVFQSRAATETYSPNFRAVFLGYLPLIFLGCLGIWQRAKLDPRASLRKMRWAGLGLFVALNLVMLGFAGSHSAGYFLGLWGWVAILGVAVCSVALSADENPTWNLFLSWAFVGMIAIYFPGLFQRKLTMGLSIPWAILGAEGLWSLLTRAEPGTKRLSIALATLVTCASSALWLLRDFSFINLNVSNTTRHPVYLDPDLSHVIDLMNVKPGRNVLLALPGVGSPNQDSDGKSAPDSFSSPLLPDVAPIVTGLTGTYTYAGHWSETPDYTKRLGEIYRFFLSQPVNGISEVMNAEQRREFERKTGANYALLPSNPEGLPLVSPGELGKVEFSGKTWTLVQLGPV